MSHINFDKQVDSIEVTDDCIILGLSSLDGNTWDGCVTTISLDSGLVRASVNLSCGVACARSLGSQILAARDDGMLSIYSIDTLDEVSRLASHNDVVSCVCVESASSSDRFYSCSFDGSICLWAADGSKSPSPFLKLRSAHTGAVNAVDVCEQNLHLFGSVGFDGFLRVWDSRVCSKGCTSLYDLSVAGSCLQWKNESSLLCGTDAGNVLELDLRVIDNAAMTTVGTHDGRVRRILSIREQPEIICSCSDDGTAKVFSLSHGTSRNELQRLDCHADFVSDVAYKLNNEELTVYSASSDKSICRTCINLHDLL